MKKGNDQEEQNKEVSRHLDRKVTVVIFFFFFKLGTKQSRDITVSNEAKSPERD